MKFEVITIFPETFESYINASLFKRARAKKLVDIRIYDLRRFVSDKHRRVDDRPYGGGPGMVLKVEPIAAAINSILKIKNQKSETKDKIKIILFSATGKQFTQKIASHLAKTCDRLIMISGHYEGVDERVKKVVYDLGFKIYELSIGPYILTGGELPAMVVIDAVSRHIIGFLGKAESLEERRYGPGVPVYTRPAMFRWRGKKYCVPRVLLSGNHKKIEEWRRKYKK